MHHWFKRYCDVGVLGKFGISVKLYREVLELPRIVFYFFFSTIISLFTRSRFIVTRDKVQGIRYKSVQCSELRAAEQLV